MGLQQILERLAVTFYVVTFMSGETTTPEHLEEPCSTDLSKGAWVKQRMPDIGAVY